MIDKVSAKVAYAIVSFGGFLGVGEDYYPLPLPNLKYDMSVSGCRVGISEDQLKRAPRFDRNTEYPIVRRIELFTTTIAPPYGTSGF